MLSQQSCVLAVLTIFLALAGCVAPAHPDQTKSAPQAIENGARANV
jgi:hypothetical protein